MAAPAVAIVYEAPPGCASVEGFIERVSARAPAVKVSAAPDAPAELRVVVQVAKVRGRYSAVLRVELAGEGADGRSLVGRSCAEVVEGAALSAAMALAVVEGPPPEETPPPIPAPSAAPPPARRSEAREANAPPPRASTPAPALLVVGVDFGLASGVAPAAAPFVAPFIEGTMGRARPGAFRPRLRLEGSFTRAVTVRRGDAFASFALTAAALELCPVALPTGDGRRGLAFEPCARLTLGALRGRGIGFADARASAEPWVAPAAVARLRWELARRVHGEVGVSAFVPLTRPRFVLGAPEASAQAHAVPSVGVSAAMGLGASFF